MCINGIFYLPKTIWKNSCNIVLENLKGGIWLVLSTAVPPYGIKHYIIILNLVCIHYTSLVVILYSSPGYVIMYGYIGFWGFTRWMFAAINQENDMSKEDEPHVSSYHIVTN